VRQGYYYSDNNEVVEFSAMHQHSDALEACARELFEVVAPGEVRIYVNQRLALRDATDAHEALEARATSGATILTIWPSVHRSSP
jgi:NADPH:quinone reductase-like Zn-dependent oxidoreductase